MIMLWMALVGCRGGQDDSSSDGGAVDADGDGYPVGDDCNDADPAIHPGAEERCDARDEDCNGSIDDDPLDGLPFYADADGDTFGDEDAPRVACDQPGGYAWNAQDCDDQRKDVHPGATETCDGTDEDCDEDVDEGCA